LSEKYEQQLVAAKLSDSVLAYRKIQSASGRGGKCNIHFAMDAFLRIHDIGDCCVIAMDISSFFEKLDHNKLYRMWCRTLGVGRLDADHFQIFKAITRYAIVDKLHVYERLGHFGPKRVSKNGALIPGYLT